MQARYTVDRSTNPHTIDYTLKDGRQQLGLWRFEGATARESTAGLMITLRMVDGQTGRTRIFCRLTGSDLEELARRAAAALPVGHPPAD